jgi:hypothetical protein
MLLATGGGVGALLALAAAAAGTVPAPTSDPLAGALYRDASQPIEARLADLMSRMTLEEKAAQLGYSLFGCTPGSGGYIGGCNAWAGGGDSSCAVHRSQAACEPPSKPTGCYWVTRGGRQQCLSAGGFGANAQDGPAVRNAVQKKVMETTRLKIPASFYGETTHCGGARGTTVFPMPCSQGSSWNQSLVGAIGAANALELRSAGGDQALSPILQVATDPRFGRLEENFAEDPCKSSPVSLCSTADGTITCLRNIISTARSASHTRRPVSFTDLVGAYGVAAIRGLQGDGGGLGPSTYLPDPTKHVASQAKHFVSWLSSAIFGFDLRDVTNGETVATGDVWGWRKRWLYSVWRWPVREDTLRNLSAALARRDAASRWAWSYGRPQHDRLAALPCQQEDADGDASQPLWYGRWLHRQRLWQRRGPYEQLHWVQQ